MPILTLIAYIAIYALGSAIICGITCYVIHHNKRIAYVLRNGSSLGMPARRRDYLDLSGRPLPRLSPLVIAGKRY